MKSIAWFAILAFLSSVCFGVEYLRYNDAKTVIKEKDSRMLIYFGAKWCDYCKDMEEVLMDQEVSLKLKESGYVVVKLDIDSDKALKKKFSVKSIPDVIITDGSDNILRRHKGYQDKESFSRWIDF